MVYKGYYHSLYRLKIKNCRKYKKSEGTSNAIMIKLPSAKRKYIAIVILIIFIMLLIAFLFKFFIGSVTIRTNSEDYCNFEGFQGYSNLEIFPSSPTDMGEVTNYYYSCIDTLMDPACKIIMECVFDSSEGFEEECSRLSRITVKNDENINEIQYSENLFQYPAFIAIYDWSSCFEYALILEEQNKIVYVFLQGSSQKTDAEYMPLSLKNENKGFSIYSFNGVLDLKYR